MKCLKYLFPASCTLACLMSCHDKPALELLASSQTGIHFNNSIIESDSINVIDFSNIYNGGGVGIGDFNNDGLQDVYFTGNMVSNKLYLNEGDFKFKDVTAASSTVGNGRWSRGVSVIDINNDGWLDLYVCTTIWHDASQRKNILYINKGVDSNGIPHFIDMAGEYGLDDTTHTTMANFFDYDNDGDLDVFLAVNEIREDNYPNMFKPIVKDGSFYSTCRLYRNDMDSTLLHPVFHDVSKQAHILIEGYSHAATVADINNDGWEDIYVTNDYLSNNVLYINNKDGTFTDKAKSYFKHTSANSMGQDIVDLNNDGLADIVELDMNPQDNYRKKMMLNGNSYLTYQNSDYFGYQYQYVRNTIQMNQGYRLTGNDSVSDPVFSDVGFYSKIAETDWSWAPLVADFDNDGLRDILITNGFPKDVTDHDFVAYRKKALFLAPKKMMLKQIPEVKISNYFFHNNGEMNFTDESAAWGISKTSFSNGAAYADLDNDGDLDMVINNINDEAFVYRNNTDHSGTNPGKYIKIKFTGNSSNRNGIGAKVSIFYNGKRQVFENTPYRGYLSSMEDIAHFGVGNASFLDSVVIRWPTGKMQVLRHVKTNQLLNVSVQNALLNYSYIPPAIATSNLFRDITDSIRISYCDTQEDVIDFDYQRLIPHKLSEYGPALAAGDINGDGMDDIVTGGAYGKSAQLFIQQTGGNFVQKSLLADEDVPNKRSNDMGILLFDADNDKDLDIYIAAGGFRSPPGSGDYQDHLYINDGKGNFTADTIDIPKNFTSKSCVRACDFDKDGDLDLLVAGRVAPLHYPSPVSAHIYRNDSKQGHIMFTDVTESNAEDLINIGLVCDAIFSDFDNDGWPDIIATGEWMPVKFLKNNNGSFKDVTQATGIIKNTGWWTSLLPGDFDNDGDIDYVAGNTGLNSFYDPSPQFPVCIRAKDFDNNGSFDALMSSYLCASQADLTKKEYPSASRNELISQIPSLKKKFSKYKDYAEATMNDLLTQEQQKGELMLDATNLRSSFLRNDGSGKFTMIPLPMQAQLSVINGMVAEDFDGDGLLDIVVNSNDFGTEQSLGRYDAMNGLFLKGLGDGHFEALPIMQSGIFIPGNGKSLVKLINNKGECIIAATQNKGPLKIFALRKDPEIYRVAPDDSYALLKLSNGKTRKVEINYGSSFLSQSSRFLLSGKNIVSAIIINTQSRQRRLF